MNPTLLQLAIYTAVAFIVYLIGWTIGRSYERHSARRQARAERDFNAHIVDLIQRERNALNTYRRHSTHHNLDNLKQHINRTNYAIAALKERICIPIEDELAEALIEASR